MERLGWEERLSALILPIAAAVGSVRQALSRLDKGVLSFAIALSSARIAFRFLYRTVKVNGTFGCRRRIQQWR
jgi:hypothetical protein